MSTTTDTAPKDPYIRGTDETVLLDLRELRAQEAADKAAREAAALGPGTPGTPEAPSAPGTPGTELERYHGSHRRDAVLYADGGTAIPLDRVREVCHDLRQPVAAILMLASAAELRPDVPERVRDVLQEIMSQTEEISATVRQFLDDAKQGVDGLGEPVPCNVASLAAESVERWRATFDGDLAMAAAEDPLHVTVDPVLFKRALGNVLSNGTRAAGDSGRVQVTVRRFETAEGERAVIEVDDSGPGFGNIPAGHGLGLAVVRRTIEAAGGAVEFADGPLGGALVRLVLPVTPIRPLSAGDELTRTFHGEISLSQLAAELAAGSAGGFGVHPALAEFDDDDFDDLDHIDDIDDFDDFDELDDSDDFAGVHEVGITPASSGHALTGGHAFTTRISAWPEPLAISGVPEQLAIGGDAGAANPFGGRNAETAGNRSYFGLPPHELAAPQTPEPEPAEADRGFFGAAKQKSPATDSGYFGLPLKSDNAAPVPAPHGRLYGSREEIAPADTQQRSDISAHPVPAGLMAAHRAATSQAPQGGSEDIRAGGQPQERTMSSAAIANTAHPAAAQTSNAQTSNAQNSNAQNSNTQSSNAQAPADAAATASAAAAQEDRAASQGSAQVTAAADRLPADDRSAQVTAATGRLTAGDRLPDADWLSAAAPPAAANPAADQLAAALAASQSAPTAPAVTPPAAAGQCAAAAAEQLAAQAAAHHASVTPTTPATPAAATLPTSAQSHIPAPASAPAPGPVLIPAPLPTPTYDPSDTQPLHIIPTGQDDTALASIQLPSQANLTHPPRIPASALRPVAEVQLSLLPGGAF